MMTRRIFLLLLLAFLGVDFAVGHFIGRSGTPSGWKTERWQAGFGSWGTGGFGLAYDISMPKEYDFVQKCGQAWVGQDDDEDDFMIKLSFMSDSKEGDDDFDDYMKSDAQRAAIGFGKSLGDIETRNAIEVTMGAFRFSRIDLAIKNARIDQSQKKSSKIETVRAFRLKGDKLHIIANFRDPELLAVNERIVGSLRRARGFGLVDLLVGAIPNLLGC